MGKSVKNIKLGFLAYRDIEDKKRFEIHPFTDDIHSLEKFIEKLIANGGGDTPEDVIGALQKASEFQFSKEGMNMIMLFCDAPCHGKYYHNEQDNIRDDHEVPEGTLEKELKKLDT